MKYTRHSVETTALTATLVAKSYLNGVRTATQQMRKLRKLIQTMFNYEKLKINGTSNIDLSRFFGDKSCLASCYLRNTLQEPVVWQKAKEAGESAPRPRTQQPRVYTRFGGLWSVAVHDSRITRAPSWRGGDVCGSNSVLSNLCNWAIFPQEHSTADYI